MSEPEPVHASGFASLSDFKRPRSWPLVLAFYAFYAFIGIVIVGIVATIIGNDPDRTYEQNFHAGMIIGTIVAMSYGLSICLIITYQRNAWRDTTHLFALFGTAICGFLLGTIGAMIPPSLLLLRTHSKFPTDTPR